jgi:hypothetical protein
VTSFRAEDLHGRWTRSHEEDTPQEQVFRPAGHRFPPARGRASFELRPDGTYAEHSPGPVDVPVASVGQWALEEDRLILGSDGDDPGHAWEIAELSGDRLVVKRKPTA